MNKGILKWYSEQTGYGVNQPAGRSKDVFVHISALERAGLRGLSEGLKVICDLQTDYRTGWTSVVNFKAA